jgi:diguanylate cyclase (GGDEF)-like protein
MSAAIVAGDGTIVAVNPMWLAFTADNGGAASGYLGENYFLTCDKSSDPAIVLIGERLRALVNQKHGILQFEYPCDSPDTRRWYLMQASRLLIARRCYLVVCHIDITHRRLAEEAAHKRADYDDLTGLLVRGSFHRRLRQALEKARQNGSRLAVFFMDLNHLKHVNDTLGHAAGDRLLIETGHRLEQTLRGMDSVARIGGDEFAFFCEDINEHTIKRVKERVRASLQQPIMIDGHGGVSADGAIGASYFPDDGDNARILLRTADERMYLEKQSVRGKSVRGAR